MTRIIEVKNERRVRVSVERCDPETHNFWAGSPEDLGWLSEEEIQDLEKDPGVARIFVG